MMLLLCNPKLSLLLLDLIKAVLRAFRPEHGLLQSDQTFLIRREVVDEVVLQGFSNLVLHHVQDIVFV